MKEGDGRMKIKRTVVIETSDIQIGDQINIGHYTATCQEITPKGALFLLDQYLDKAYQMNPANTNEGGYEESNLRKELQSKEVLNIFANIRDRMVPFDNGDLLRIPFYDEIFGQEDGCEQWELMKDRKNRIAFRQNYWEWGWLQNKHKGSAALFPNVTDDGNANFWGVSNAIGVRPVFIIKI